MVQQRDGAGDPVVDAERRIAGVMADRATSFWLKHALEGALDRDPVDAVDDAEALLEMLNLRAQAIVDREVDNGVTSLA